MLCIITAIVLNRENKKRILLIFNILIIIVCILAIVSVLFIGFCMGDRCSDIRIDEYEDTIVNNAIP